MNSYLASLLTGLVLLLPLAGCTSKPDDRTPDGRIIVHYWEKWTGFEGDAIQAVIDDFNTSQNRIFVERMTVGEMARKLMLATAGGDPPDLAGLWTGAIPDFSEKGALTPLNKMVERAGIKRDDYIPVFWDLCTHHGFVWALPSTPTSVALHWNKRLFRKAGLDPNRPPRSLTELESMSDRLTIVEIKRDGKLVPVRYPDLTDAEKAARNFKLIQAGHLPTEPGWWMPMWIHWFGGRFWDGNRTITANDPANVQAYEWFRQEAEKFGVDNLRSFGASFGNFDSPQSSFLAEKVAMVLQGVWMYNFVEKYAPQMQWGAAPFPAKEPARFPSVTIVESDVLVIPKGARHPREAFEFIRYVNSQGPMEKLNLAQRKFSPLARVSDGFIHDHPNPYIQVFVDLAKSPDAHYLPRLSIWNVYNDEVSVAVDGVTSLNVTPLEALARAQRRVQWKFDRVLRSWDAVKDERIKEWSADDPR